MSEIVKSGDFYELTKVPFFQKIGNMAISGVIYIAVVVVGVVIGVAGTTYTFGKTKIEPKVEAVAKSLEDGLKHIDPKALAEGTDAVKHLAEAGTDIVEVIETVAEGNKGKGGAVQMTKMSGKKPGLGDTKTPDIPISVGSFKDSAKKEALEQANKIKEQAEAAALEQANKMKEQAEAAAVEQANKIKEQAEAQAKETANNLQAQAIAKTQEVTSQAINAGQTAMNNATSQVTDNLNAQVSNANTLVGNANTLVGNANTLVGNVSNQSEEYQKYLAGLDPKLVIATTDAKGNITRTLKSPPKTGTEVFKPKNSEGDGSIVVSSSTGVKTGGRKTKSKRSKLTNEPKVKKPRTKKCLIQKDNKMYMSFCI